jgi:diguanylate cyclase (GGDEF)-like protein/PAS domain S-box-containing protein
MWKFISGKSGQTSPIRVAPVPRQAARAAAQSVSLRSAWRIRPVRSVVYVGFLLVSAIAIAGSLIVTNLRDQALADQEKHLESVASLLAMSTDRAFKTVEVIQDGLIERMRALGIATAEDYEQRMSGYDNHLMLKDKDAGWAQIGSITLINSRGKLFNFSRFWPLPDIDVTDREFFKVLKSSANLTSFMGEPVRNRANGNWTIHLVRKVSGPNGEFLGLILGAMDMPYFEQHFESVAMGEGSSISLFRDDGVLLARHPSADSSFARFYSQDEVLMNVLSRAKDGAVQQIGSVEGEERLIAAKRLDHYPFVIVATTTVAATLADWQKSAIEMIGVLLLMVAAFAGSILLCARQVGMSINKQKVRMDAALHNMRQGLLMFNREGQLVLFNQRYLQMYGLAPESVKPDSTLADLLRLRKAAGTFKGNPDQYAAKLVDPAGKFRGDPDLATFIGEGVETKVIELPDGRSVSITNQSMPGGGWVSTHSDITEMRHAERELDRTRSFLDTVVDNVPATLVVKNAHDRRYVVINRAGERFFGLSREEMIGKTSDEVFSKQEADAIRARDEELLRSTKEMFLKAHPLTTPRNGTRIVTTKKVTVRDDDGTPRYLVNVIEDVTEIHRAEARIEHMARHDPLTDLPNRDAFTEQLAVTLERATEAKKNFAVMYIDLDRFMTIKNIFGSSVGDPLMCEISRRLQSAAEGAFLARVGGHKFAVIDEGPQPSSAQALADRLLAIGGKEIEIAEHLLRVGITIGVAIFPVHGAEVTTLLGNLDAAFYRAKGESRGSARFFEADMELRLREERALQLDLRSAAGCGELELYYQPQALIGGEIVGFEALLRWNHPTRGMISPGTFVPIAEESGLIVAIGEWVLREACREAASWPQPLQVALNLSPIQFQHGDLPGLVHSVLLETGLAPGRLELEITENVLIDDFSRGLSILRRLKLLGVRIAMDDFGTGYSSLSYLQSFPFDKIKIDQTFISNLEHNPQSATIVRAVIGLGRGLDLPVVAEGVETREQLAFLTLEACDEVQGYLIGRPLPIADYAELVGRPAVPQQKRAVRNSRSGA